jgi:hydroxymethylglutaryl-CoA synthase
MLKVGISDLGLYLPVGSLDLQDLVLYRAAQGFDGARLAKALAATGQRASRVPAWYEDTVTMCAEAAAELLRRRPGPCTLRHLLAGTETEVDHAKPVATWVQGLLEEAGLLEGRDLASFEVKHACAGGTYALLASLGLLQLSSGLRPADRALVVLGDIARYQEGGTAEITQGAGALALLLETNPALLEIDPVLAAFHGHSVDDFFRPLGAENASVRGRFSMECYDAALRGALRSHLELCASAGQRFSDGADFLAGFDYLLLHAPFRQMPLEAASGLLAHLGVQDIPGELARLRLEDSLEATASAGNLYNASLYLCLRQLLTTELARLGPEALVGRRLLLASYGSGNTMAIFQATVAPRAPGVIAAWGPPPSQWPSAPVAPAAYEAARARCRLPAPQWNALAEADANDIPKAAFHLRSLRPDGYRVYGSTGSLAFPKKMLDKSQP